MRKIVVLFALLSIIIFMTGCNQKAKNVVEKDRVQERWVIENSTGVLDNVDLKIIEEELEKLDRLEESSLLLMPLDKIAHTNYIQVYNDAAINNAKNEEEKFHVEVCFFKENGDDFELRGKDNLKKEEVQSIFREYFLNHKIPHTSDWYLVS